MTAPLGAECDLSALVDNITVPSLADRFAVRYALAALALVTQVPTLDGDDLDTVCADITAALAQHFPNHILPEGNHHA
ncbi:hypothetical protein G4X40_18730 [Rhodococcus sp. D2-41]|uniref:hypothetical protein n=1 Tax=Speluncibacter jeojiensis TaxID=2710754 RepID=UPI00240F95C5|nr:hypothetical protein [Rhodococcus sp. D2-41]MDG3012180.1 hypothetical protein [Rhodococcus sp. D2-41]